MNEHDNVENNIHALFYDGATAVSQSISQAKSLSKYQSLSP